MEWADLKHLDTRLLALGAQGAQVTVIGTSGEGRPLYEVAIGAEHSPFTVVVVAGMHADEVTGPLAALALLQTLVHNPWTNIQLRCVPVADPDMLARNADQLPPQSTLRDIVNLRHVRDLEWQFTADTYPESRAIRHWMERLPRIDAYISLHTAHLITPGLFFYISSTSAPACVSCVAARVAATLPPEVPLVAQDPTNIAQAIYAPGFFALPASVGRVHDAESSFAFVGRRFQPRFAGVTETPLAICAALAHASLDEIEQYNRSFRDTGHAVYPYVELDLTTQVDLMHLFMRSSVHCLLAHTPY